MSELAIKVSDSPTYQDGDVLQPFNRRCIRLAHAQRICNLKQAGFNSDGLRPTGSLADRFRMLTQEFVFQRVGDRTVERIDLWNDNESTVLDETSIDVRRQLAMRLQHPRRPVFGARGHEHWYGGRLRQDHATLDAIWDQIQQHSLHRERDHQRWPASSHELRQHLFVSVDDFDEEQASLLTASAGDERGIIEKRACTVPWRELAPLGSLKHLIPDPFQLIDVRDLWTWMRDDILRLKGVGNVINVSVLQDELTNDPLARGYAGMTDAEVATSLNSQNRPIVADVASRVLLEWAAGGALSKIRRAAEPDFVASLMIGGLPATQAQKDAVQSAASATYLLLTRADTAFNATRHQPMVDLLVSAGVLTTDERTSLNSLSQRLGSRAEELGMDAVFPSYITHVRRADV